MPTFADAGQRAKRMAPLSKSGASKPRAAQNTASTTSTSNSGKPQAPAATPVKDIYDYDFVDDVAPTPKLTTKPRPFSNTKPVSRGISASSSSASASASLSASPLPRSVSSTTTPRQQSSAVRQPASRATTETTRSLKRKPSFLDATPTQRSTGYASASSVPSTSRYTGTQQAKRVQRPSASPDSIAVVTTSPPLHKQSRPIGKTTAAPPQPSQSSQPSAASLARQRVTKTPPPRNTVTARLKSPTSMRSPSASPRKTPSAQVASIASIMRKPQPTPVAKYMPFHPVDGPSTGRSPKTAASPRQPPVRATPAARPTFAPSSTQRKRRRLIDTLVDQQQEESSSEEDEPSQQKSADSDDDSEANTILSKYKNIRSTPISDDRQHILDLESIVTGSPSKPQLAPATPATITRTQNSRRKFVYNVQRTMLAEDPISLDGPQGSDLSVLESLLPEADTKQDSYDFDDDAGASQGAIQSIHELRQAGANSRYADELVDIMDRVGAPSAGKPNSARRGALVELAQKLQERSFLRQFRDQGADMKLFRNVGKETDTIAGYTIACIAVSLFSTGSVSPRLLREIQQHKIKDLFTVLLKVDTDIEAVTKSRDPRDRKNRTSPHMSQQLVGLRETMKKNSAVWKPATVAPSKLSPRTITLKALHMFAQQLQAASGGIITGLDEDDGALSAVLTKELFEVISSALPSPYADDYNFGDGDGDNNGSDGGNGDKADAPPSVLTSGLTSKPQSADVYLALSLLEMHSVAAMQSDISAEWTRNYLPIIAGALDDSLVWHQQEQQEQEERSHRLNDLELLVLKLALNTANNNPDAARFYVEKGLLRRLAELSAVSLAAVVRSAKTGEEYASDALNELLLMLGVMINFSENDSAAGATFAQGGGGLVLLDKLGKTFLDGRAIAAEADSEEKSQLNVAFAYLSILLGYLCLHDPIYQAFRRLSPSRNLNPLLESIRHFINLHDQLGKAEHPEHGADASHFTERLRALAHELEVRAY